MAGVPHQSNFIALAFKSDRSPHLNESLPRHSGTALPSLLVVIVVAEKRGAFSVRCLVRCRVTLGGGWDRERPGTLCLSTQDIP